MCGNRTIARLMTACLSVALVFQLSCFTNPFFSAAEESQDPSAWLLLLGGNAATAGGAAACTRQALPDNSSTTDWFNMSGNILLLHMEDSSTSIADSSASGFSGSYNGVLNGQVGVIDSALGFDGLNDFVNLGTPAVLQSIGSGSVTFWFQPSVLIDSSSATTDFVSKNAAGGQTEDFILHILGGTGQFRIDLRNDSNTLYQIGSDSTSWNAGVWYHIVAIWNNSDGSIDLYVDGALQSASGNQGFAGTTLRPSEQFAVGANATGASAFPGRIDELAVWRRALSSTEVSTLYTTQSCQ